MPAYNGQCDKNISVKYFFNLLQTPMAGWPINFSIVCYFIVLSFRNFKAIMYYIGDNVVIFK